MISWLYRLWHFRRRRALFRLLADEQPIVIRLIVEYRPPVGAARRAA